MYKRNFKKSKTRKVSSRLLPKIFKLQQLILRAVLLFSRSFFVKSQRQRRRQQAGFVLPTAVLVLLVMSLVIAALLFRSLSRSTQVIGEHQQQVIYNAASPAIDRARAKLEYLFNGDNRLPSGVPPEITLTSMMLNDGSNNITKLSSDPYTLPGETRLDLNGDGGNADNAWSFQINANGGTSSDTTIAYSILWNTPSSTDPQLKDTSNTAVQSRAKVLEVRNGPQGSNLLPQACLTGQNSPQAINQGWFDANAYETKNFQIDAVVIPNNSVNGTISTLELEQDRQYNKGNFWGAWFRYDIEGYPGSTFNWNGAIHTEGSLFMAPEGGNINGYMISSPTSCLYTQSASQITVGRIQSNGNTNINGGNDFDGQIVNGSINGVSYNQNAYFHLFNGIGQPPIQSQSQTTLEHTSTTVTDSININNGSASDFAKIALDPVNLFTLNISQARGGDSTNKTVENNTWDAGNFNTYKRIFRQSSTVPYVDDTYRADNRYGPKPTYGLSAQLKVPGNIGQVIQSTDPNLTAATYQELTSNIPTVASDSTSVGLDGYWERRARNEGLRIIVGQRLELGNAFGWGGSGNTSQNGNSDPLYPPVAGKSISNEARQRRTQRDNLAAVQSTVFYQYKQNSDLVRSDTINSKNGYFPIACLATTYHAGTSNTESNSNNTSTTNFFIGQGTNGIEYTPPSNGSEKQFAQDFDNASSGLRIALTNLAYFAGDPNGGAPSYTPVQDTVVHPYPYLNMWGDFSHLRQILDSGTKYIDLSIADQSYLHTAACTLGMLATNIKNIPTQIPANGNANLTTLTNALLTIGPLSGNPVPEAYIQKLIQVPVSNNIIQLAQLIMVNEQINRDRTYGFLTGSTCSYAANNPLSNLCFNKPKYPSLFYLFPFIAHDYQGNDSSGNAVYYNGNSIRQTTITPPESYVSDPYLSSIAQRNTTGISRPITTTSLVPQPAYYQYQIINLSDPDISLSQQTVLPRDTASGNLGFRETAFLNGREMMNVRILDVDLNILRQTPVPSKDDTWLPKTGIIYAFREDAVREDSIVRPAGNNMCLNTSQGCSSPPTDPTIVFYNSTDNPPKHGITTKPVDYYADPDRRPHGFRLVNGQTVARNWTGISAADNIHGLSFVSDDYVYILGDFNYHSTDGTSSNLIQEFKDYIIQSDWTHFYDRQTRDSRFAQPGQDYWRPVEILADGTSILSNNFINKEGSIQDFFTGSTSSSYSNQNGVQSKPTGAWITENPYDSSTPIVFSQNGNPMYCSGTSPCSNPQEYDPTKYYSFSNNRTIIVASSTRVNATLIGGIIPSQANQYYGGFHNFPRFMENWGGINLFFSGAFLQLNFATSATAPFDQDAWEPPNTPVSAEYKSYYSNPVRLWGYDVGLQYAPAGPVSQRFVALNNSRSEFYQELPANDPYILRLRCAKPTTGSNTTQTIDPNVSSASCS